eukprot:9782126-Alexandrium_andersonii.AAC.1
MCAIREGEDVRLIELPTVHIAGRGSFLGGLFEEAQQIESRLPGLAGAPRRGLQKKAYGARMRERGDGGARDLLNKRLRRFTLDSGLAMDAGTVWVQNMCCLRQSVMPYIVGAFWQAGSAGMT